MDTIAWLMLVAGVLPFIAAASSKAGGKGFDNDNPRPWLALQGGWRGRLNAAQANLFESLPFFYAAVLFALYKMADPAMLATLMTAWVAARIVYVVLYAAGYGTLRSLVWVASLGLNIAILFSAAT
ncbi:MAPEG family protein [Alcaligenaceae bacterium]|nr:MAPEG family protein [Alcaligenaceae bacterium]